ncbi:MAG: formylglycine-generating enzyme family protein [Nitrospirae bacterium]|nr:MAG: formylglycine-generating enzyme family protein [Nitrospirota bacterium]
MNHRLFHVSQFVEASQFPHKRWVRWVYGICGLLGLGVVGGGNAVGWDQGPIRPVSPIQVRDATRASGNHASPPLTTITGRDGAPMVLLPAGEFWMGTSEQELAQLVRDCVQAGWRADRMACEQYFSDEQPRHRVVLDAFYLDQFEVTNAQFAAFVRSTGYVTTAEREGWAYAYVQEQGTWQVKDVVGASWRKPDGVEDIFQVGHEQHPVTQVSWEDAHAYCQWAGKRLPTEAEFEYATRAGTSTRFWWGQAYPSTRLVGNFADEAAKRQFPQWGFILSGYDDGYVKTAPVGSFERNAWGLADMIGNVWEWTADWYEKNYYAGSPALNPKGPLHGEERVIRGGSWHSAPQDLRSALRMWITPTVRTDKIGFRCAQDARL